MAEPSESQSYQELLQNIKYHLQNGFRIRALETAKTAMAFAPSEEESAKLTSRIEKLEAAKGTVDEDDDDADMAELGNAFYIAKHLIAKLYSYQKEGVLWMWRLYRTKQGGILGDDMGLGKTIQVIVFLSGLLDADLIKTVLIVMPVSLLRNWEREFEKWTSWIRVLDYHGQTQRERNCDRVMTRGGVLLTTYGLLGSEYLAGRHIPGFAWDYVILDEGHHIKNPTKTTKAAHSIPARQRLVLTGTAIQNNLNELWSLFDFTHQGTLLGNSKTFKAHFEQPITKAREKDANPASKCLGNQMSETLRKKIEPYFLRRTKDEVRKAGSNFQNPNEPEIPALLPKSDLIVWIPLTQKQISLYQDFLDSETVKQVLMSKRSPLVQLTLLKKICDHPRLLNARAVHYLGWDQGKQFDTEVDQEQLEDMNMAQVLERLTDAELLEESKKLQFLRELVRSFKNEDHTCLIFSLSRKMLDIIQRVLKNDGHEILRIDGTITSTEERQKRIDLFQTTKHINAFLLTTRVGGVGLTLTAADRVIIYDPSWNPALDAQAVDRAYRIGQKRPVIVYRLITCGTVEEKIYRRQIFKNSIIKQATGESKDPFRYFSRQELRELFVLDNPLSSATQQQLSRLHANSKKTSPGLQQHISYLHTLGIFGLSDHDLMFENVHNEDEDDLAMDNTYIQKRAQEALNLVEVESCRQAELISQDQKFVRPDLEQMPVPKYQANEGRDLHEAIFQDDLAKYAHELIPSPPENRVGSKLCSSAEKIDDNKPILLKESDSTKEVQPDLHQTSLPKYQVKEDRDLSETIFQGDLAKCAHELIPSPHESRVESKYSPPKEIHDDREAFPQEDMDLDVGSAQSRSTDCFQKKMNSSVVKQPCDMSSVLIVDAPPKPPAPLISLEETLNEIVGERKTDTVKNEELPSGSQKRKYISPCKSGIPSLSPEAARTRQFMLRCKIEKDKAGNSNVNNKRGRMMPSPILQDNFSAIRRSPWITKREQSRISTPTCGGNSRDSLLPCYSSSPVKDDSVANNILNRALCINSISRLSFLDDENGEERSRTIEDSQRSTSFRKDALNPIRCFSKLISDGSLNTPHCKENDSSDASRSSLFVDDSDKENCDNFSSSDEEDFSNQTILETDEDVEKSSIAAERKSTLGIYRSKARPINQTDSSSDSFLKHFNLE